MSKRELEANSEASKLIHSGQQALVAGDWESAKDAFAHAVDAEETPEALEGLGMAAWWLDDGPALFAARERSYVLYRQRHDLLGAARVASWLALDNYIFRHAPAVANGWLHRAERILSAISTPTFEHCFLAFCRGHIALEEQDNHSVRRYAAEALTLARELNIVDFEMLALALHGLALVSEGSVEEGMSQLDEAATAAVSGELSDPDAMVTSCCYLFYACERVRDYDRASQWCENITALCQRWSYRSMVSVCRAHYASVLIWRGEWAVAEAELTKAIQELSRGREGWAVEAFLRLGELRRRQGRLDEAADMFARASQHPLSLLGMAELALSDGDATRATGFIQRFFRRVPKDELTQHFNGLEILIRVHLEMDELDRAEETLDELKRVARSVGTGPLEASASLATGLVRLAQGDLATAQHALEDAVDLYLSNGAPFEAARARIALSRALGVQGHSAIAVAESRTALETFNSLGAKREAGHAEELIRELVRERGDTRSTSPQFERLTNRESEILSLIAAGYSNPQIADELYLSVRTVERHISSIYQKIGADGTAARAIATAYALEHGATRSLNR